MSNICTFSITITGPRDDRKRFADSFRSTVQTVLGGSHDGEIYAYPVERDWNDFDEDEPQWLQIEQVWTWWVDSTTANHCVDLDETILELDNCHELRGSCKWGPPVCWLEKVSNFYPTLSFRCCSTTEHELFEEWIVCGAEVKRVRLEVMDWDGADGAGEWVSLDPNTKD